MRFFYGRTSAVIISAALMVSGCGSKVKHSQAGGLAIDVVCSSLGEKATDKLPPGLVELYSILPIENKGEFRPTVTFQRIDVEPLPAPLKATPSPGVGQALETMLGTWSSAKAQRALRLQAASLAIGKSYSKEVAGNAEVWQKSLRTIIERDPNKAIYALQAGDELPAKPFLEIGTRHIPILIGTAAIRSRIAKAFAVTEKPSGCTIVYLGDLEREETKASGQQEDLKAPHRAAKAALRIHGSNTIGSVLMPMLVEEFLKTQQAQAVTRLPTEDPEQTLIQWSGGGGSGSTQLIEIASHGSATGFADLALDECDIAMSSRPITPEEEQSCASAGLGNMLSDGCEHVLGLDGIAVIVHRSNPIQSLSKSQLAEIFSGRIKDWRELQNIPGAIVLYAQDDKSGTFATFKALALGGDLLSQSAHRFESSSRLVAEVSRDARAIGIVGRAFVDGVRAVPISDEGRIPYVPNARTIATEDYPLSRRLYLYTPANSPNPLVAKFLEFALADNQGQVVLDEAGFVGQRIKVDRPEGPKRPAPERYVEETRNADRIDLNFRFRSSSSELDSKAVRDVERVGQLLDTPGYSGKFVVLFGFADSSGHEDFNLALSRDRAQVVADKLRAQGVNPTVVTGFGSALPLASNDTPQGREKNRRVEIWLRNR